MYFIVVGCIDIKLPLEYSKGIEQCAADHGKVGKLCEECGWKK